ncbi:hypothetical protein SAXI111661_21610 [Saccharomonospora xinjiangensis]|uniref:hypothetical protein n=1 Tax=Saccharomonospora xinjiangensis TaxID=75294 RepID=UPI00106F83B4|nr:hypothetical protein [Saccharomonospora xinjiangensis]QBQ61172.1 hypothetical protein EYD13_14100 [Saccharomonospora xinjiangensis]
MTYPPQQGGQQGPYGQQGHFGGWTPQQGQPAQPQAPQAYGQPHGAQTFGQQQPQQGLGQLGQLGQPYGGMPPGQPPQQSMPPAPKKKTGLWVGVSVAVVALAAFGVTGFVAPGFLLSGDDSGRDGAGGGTDFGDSEAAAVAEQVAQGWSNGDYEALKKLICPADEPKLHGFATDAPYVTKFEVTSGLQEKQNPPSASFKASIDLENEGKKLSVNATFTVENSSGSWCWSDIKEG